MGWIDKPHRCNVPLLCYGSVGTVGRWYECDHCHKEWQVQARVPLNDGTHYGLTFVRREGDFIITLSWQEII
jgi:hypothetical protein